MIIPGSTDSDDFEFDDPDLEKLMSMAVNWHTWQWVIGYVTVIMILATGSDIWFASNTGFRPIFEGETIRTGLTPIDWFQVVLRVVIPAFFGIAAVVSLRNPHNSTCRTWFLLALIAICIEVSFRAIVAHESVLRLWLDGFVLMLCIVCIGCLYAEREYVWNSVNEADRRLEELGYRE